MWDSLGGLVSGAAHVAAGGVDPVLLNALVTVVVAILIPLVGALWRAITKLNNTLDRAMGNLFGADGSGGGVIQQADAEIRDLRRRMHRQESLTTALLVHTGVKVPDLE